jgi:copper homeostasis protein CutC
MTKNTIITWLAAAEVTRELTSGSDRLGEERSYKIAQMLQEEKTDGLPTMESVYVHKRNWVDQAAAEEYVTFIIGLAAKYNTTIVSTEIVDYVAP